MIYQIPYTVYQFEGKLIDEHTYNDLKKAFTTNPYLEFPPPKSYYEEHMGEARLTIITFAICLILAPFGEAIEGTIFMLLLAMSFIGFFFSVIFQFSQYTSFQKVRTQKINFFKKLKSDIIENADYRSFVISQKKAMT